MLWSPKLLKPGYERAIIGWDQRMAPPFMSVTRSEIPFLGDWFDFKIPTLSIEKTVWPSIIEKNIKKFNNGFDFLDSFEIKNVPNFDRLDAWIIQFELPLQYVENFEQFFTDKNNNNNKFTFLGYDVVDNDIAYSSFYSFDWTKKQMKTVLEILKIRLNKYGLVSDEKSAIDAAIFFSNDIPEHSPFVPCGIWKMET